MKAIKVANLDKKFGSQHAVDGISFVAEESRFTTLLGPSGCGKTTTLRCIAGLESPSGGEILLGDKKVYAAAEGVEIPSDQRGLGMVFQNFALWPHMTVSDNIAFGLSVRGWRKDRMAERVKQVLDLIRLPDRAESFPHQLSGGQQQRVAFARALAYGPDVLLLDEPLANLDAKLREAMRYELREIHRRTGVTALYVTHDQAEAMVLSDKVIVMHDGRIEQEGSPAEIYEQPRTAFVANFIGISNFIQVHHVERRGAQFLGKSDIGFVVFRPSAGFNGGATTLSIRPEDFEVSDSRGAGEINVFPFVVRARVYQGENVALFVAAPRGQEFRVHVGRSITTEVGGTIVLHLPPNKLVALEG